jgi:YaiO family outer membrane protein
VIPVKPKVNNPEAVIPTSFLWSASLGASWTAFSPERQDWTDYSLSVRRHFEQGSLAFELLDTQRFGSSDQAWALDGYRDLWNRAYVNLRYQQGPQASLFPKNAYYAELFQGVGQGWELSGSYGRLEFSSSNVDMYGIGIGKYVGNYYIRLRHTYIPSNGSVSNSNRLLARYYYAGDGDNYIEATVSAGTSSSDEKSGVNLRTKSSALGVAYVRYPTPRWGYKIGADYGRESDSFTTFSVSGTVYLRW